MATLKWIPAPAEVNEVIDALESELMPFWKSPELPCRTLQDVIDDIAFQKQFALDKPKLAACAEERIAELNQELETFTVKGNR